MQTTTTTERQQITKVRPLRISLSPFEAIAAQRASASIYNSGAPVDVYLTRDPLEVTVRRTNGTSCKRTLPANAEFVGRYAEPFHREWLRDDLRALLASSPAPADATPSAQPAPAWAHTGWHALRMRLSNMGRVKVYAVPQQRRFTFRAAEERERAPKKIPPGAAYVRTFDSTVRYDDFIAAVKSAIGGKW